MNIIGTEDIPIHKIDPGRRLREADPATVEALAGDIFERGQLQPISVAKMADNQYRLLGGMHRLAAMSAIDEETIRAEVWDPGKENPETNIRLFEIDETLLKRDLNPLERGVFLFQRKSLYETLFPETKHGAQGGVGGHRNENEMFSFSLATAEKIGLGRRSVERACRIGHLEQNIRQRLVGTPIAEKEGELYNLTKVPTEKQSRIIDLLFDPDKPASSVKAAIKIIDGHALPTESREEKQLHKLMDAWNRAGGKTRKKFLEYLKDQKVTLSLDVEGDGE